VKVRLNPGGPSPKAKYSLATDSEPVARAKDEKNPFKGRYVNLKPHAYKRSEHYASSGKWGVSSGKFDEATPSPRMTSRFPLSTSHYSQCDGVPFA
jgi:hypothetical protein